MKRFIQGGLLVWFLLVVFLHLAPPSDRWEGTGRRITKSIRLSMAEGQAVAHVVLMAGCAFLLMYNLMTMPKKRAFILSFIACVLLSGLLELMQALVPSTFRRQCDMGDMLPAIAGAIIGCCAGLALPVSDRK